MLGHDLPCMFEIVPPGESELWDTAYQMSYFYNTCEKDYLLDACPFGLEPASTLGFCLDLFFFSVWL